MTASIGGVALLLFPRWGREAPPTGLQPERLDELDITSPPLEEGLQARLSAVGLVEPSGAR